MANVAGGIPCPHCGARASDVIDSRCPETQPYTHRRRECGKCLKRFSTVEIAEQYYDALLSEVALVRKLRAVVAPELDLTAIKEEARAADPYDGPSCLDLLDKLIAMVEGRR